MRLIRPAMAAIGAMLTIAASPVAPAIGTLRIEIGNVRGHSGRVHVDVCTEAQFLKDCPIAADVPARVGVTIVTVPRLPPGRYAVQAFYDENGNGHVDRALFGIPKEGVGFSNDAKIRMAPPKWDEARFDFPGGDRLIRLSMRYFLGGDAPR